jgi:hypothetical protein
MEVSTGGATSSGGQATPTSGGTPQGGQGSSAPSGGTTEKKTPGSFGSQPGSLSGSATSESTGNPNDHAQSGQDLEEVAIGSVKARVPKDVAQALKNLERGFHQTARERAELKKALDEARTESELFNKDPWEALKKRGLDPDQLAEARLEQRLREMEMSPEERRNRDLEQRNKTLEERFREEEQRQTRTLRERQEAAAFSDTEKQIGEAFKNSKLPKEPYMVGLVAAEMLRDKKLFEGGKTERRLTPAEITAKIENKWRTQTESFVKSLGVEDLVTLLGENGLKGLREYELRKLQGGALNSSPKSPTANPVASESRSKPKGPMSQAEYDVWEAKFKAGQV